MGQSSEEKKHEHDLTFLTFQGLQVYLPSSRHLLWLAANQLDEC
jgi:hypothetical protein